MLCLVCGVSTRKYKCPKCFKPYCSLLCYKEHRKTTCDSAQSISSQLSDGLNNQEPTVYEPFSTEDTVPRNRMEPLKNSKELHNLLYNRHLRNLLAEIDVAPDAWKAMKAAMHEPLFLEFADECLKLIESQSSHQFN